MAKATPFRKEIRPVKCCACVFGLLRRVPYCHHQCGEGGGGGWLRLGGRAADEELLPSGGGAVRRALLRATESSRLTPCWSLSACLWRSSFLRNVGSPDSHPQSWSHRSYNRTILVIRAIVFLTVGIAIVVIESEYVLRKLCQCISGREQVPPYTGHGHLQARGQPVRHCSAFCLDAALLKVS